jgi:hypothetical protein
MSTVILIDITPPRDVGGVICAMYNIMLDGFVVSRKAYE